MYPTDEYFASPEAYGLHATDYSEDVPVAVAQQPHTEKGVLEEQIMEEINQKPIFHYGVSVDDGLCDDNCNFHGDC